MYRVMILKGNKIQQLNALDKRQVLKELKELKHKYNENVFDSMPIQVKIIGIFDFTLIVKYSYLIDTINRLEG